MHSEDRAKHDDDEGRGGKSGEKAEDEQQPTEELANDDKIPERSYAQHWDSLLYAWSTPHSEEQLRSMGDEDRAEDQTHEEEREVNRVSIRRQRGIVVHVWEPVDRLMREFVESALSQFIARVKGDRAWRVDVAITNWRTAPHPRQIG